MEVLMTARRFALAASAFLSSLAFVAPPLMAQDALQQEIENSKFQATGAVNTNAVYVRSGASENDYATMKLDKGAVVTVVGERFNWLKIVPPEGSFFYVAKAYVNRAGNGSIGQVTNSLYVRVGSTLNPLKTKVATKLEPGQRVEIIGDQDEYWKIKPPADVYVYINKQFVDFQRLANANAPVAQQPGGQADPQPQAQPDTAPQQPQQPETAFVQEKPEPTNSEPPTTQANGDAVAEGAPAATQPSAEAEFDRLEAEYADASQKPLDKQPVDELLGSYQKLAADTTLPESMHRIIDWKISILKTRADLKNEYIATQKAMEEASSKRVAMQAEQKELEKRVEETTVKFYTAVGTLRTSSLQGGQHVLYRLTDPANGRTVVYLRSDDGKLAQSIGQFIGVRGDLVNDTQMNIKVVTPTAFEAVNPAQLGQGIVTQIAPASLLPGAGATANIE
jgi:uncharacterized protein YgiM (DUF1202 family)